MFTRYVWAGVCLLSILSFTQKSFAATYPVDEDIQRMRSEADALEGLKQLFESNQCSVTVGDNKVGISPGALRSRGIVIIVTPKSPGNYLAFHSSDKMSPEAIILTSQLSFKLAAPDFEASMVTAEFGTVAKDGTKSLNVGFWIPRKAPEEVLTPEQKTEQEARYKAEGEAREKQIAEARKAAGLPPEEGYDEEEPNEEFWIHSPVYVSLPLSEAGTSVSAKLSNGQNAIAECHKK